jgi:uncharacterized membrane protein YraQ (UPF0718 family)
VSPARYFAILIIALVAGLWINIMHHTQISQEWQSANLKFDEIETQLKHLQSVCSNGE